MTARNQGPLDAIRTKQSPVARHPFNSEDRVSLADEASSRLETVAMGYMFNFARAGYSGFCRLARLALAGKAARRQR